MNYVARDQVKAALSITDASKDTYIDSLIEQVSAYIDGFLNRTYSASGTPISVTAEEYSGQNMQIWLKAQEIKTVTEVKVRDARADSWTTLVVDRDFDWWPTGRLLLYDCYRFVQVSYTYGGDGVPKDIQWAALQLAIDTYNATFGSENISSERIGDYSVTYASTQNVGQAARLQVTDVLNRYRVMPV